MKECANLQAGERLGDYTIVRLLGKGGMGAVYLVHDENGAPFAAKVVMLSDDDAQREWRRRFVKEAGFAMTVHHKNLVAVHDMGEVEASGLCYIIMDYMPGGTLADLLKRKGRLGVREAVDIAIAIASVLEVAHGVGAVHRDIKPDNILFDADGTPKLTDMGIAKFGGASGSTTVTATGVIVGTPAYMSPEQMMDSHAVDARADIYSLGLVLYEMLTGMRPHADSTVVELIAKAIKGEELPDIRTIRPEVSVALSYVLSLMVAVKPEERIASAMEAAKMLHDAATDRLVMKHRPVRPSATAGNVPVRDARRGLKAVAAWAIGGLMLVAAFAVGGWWTIRSRNPPEAIGEEIKTDDDGMKLPVGSMPKAGLMVAYDYDGGAAVNSGYGTAAVVRDDVSYRDGIAMFDGKYKDSKGEDVIVPGFNYDHFSIAFSFKPDNGSEMFRIGADFHAMLQMNPGTWSGECLSVDFMDSRVKRIDMPIAIGKWNWVVLSVDFKRRLAVVAVNGKPPVERILSDDFYWMIPSDKIAGDRYRRLHFGNPSRGVRYSGAIDDLMVYDRGLTQREMQDIVRGVPHGGNATASASSEASPPTFRRAKLADGKWALAQQPEVSQYWNRTISTYGMTLGAREDANGLVVPPIGQLEHETIDLSMPVVDEAGGDVCIYAIGDAGECVYGDGSSRTAQILLPQSLRELRNCAFYGCRNLKTISLPQSLEKIGDSAFDSCAKLESISIPENVRQIGARAFGSCGCLTNVDILSRSVTIARDAFSGCTPVGSIMPKEEWTTGPVTKAIKGDPAFAYAKNGRMKEALFSFADGDIRFGDSYPDVTGWGRTPMKDQAMRGEFDVFFQKVGPGLLAGIVLAWHKNCEVEGVADEAVDTASKLVAILRSKLHGDIATPEILPTFEWPESCALGRHYARYAKIQPIGTSESEVNGYKIKVNVYCGRKDKNVAVVINVVDSYMFKAWGVPVPGE